MNIVKRKKKRKLATTNISKERETKFTQTTKKKMTGHEYSFKLNYLEK
jgi:hypothetical protein